MLETYSYAPGSGSSTTTTLVAEKKNQVNGSTVHNFKYAYDAKGNISKVTNTTANTSVAYTYDTQGQLLKAIHKKGTATQRTETYSYDTYGNLRSYSNGTNSHSYTYADANGWKDLLTKVDGHSLSYDGSGNPLSYYNGKSFTMTWNEGRQLASLTTGGKTASYTYDLNGLRTKKVNPDGTWVKYFIGEGKILGETLHAADNHEVYDMRYTFDENGEVCGISLWNQGDTSWTKYYFVKNLQGDVLAVYQYGSSFTKVAEYTYDSWGNVLTATGTLANINPFRYRSYYRDADTGFYYLQSRYYDPAIGRFINADSFASTGQDFIGYNMFAYCRNNPVMGFDPTGHAPERWQWAVSVAMFVTGVVLVATGVGGMAGGALICASTNSIIGSYVSEASGGSSVAGWAGGMITGAFCGTGAGYAGSRFMRATCSTNFTCLRNLAASGAYAFGLGVTGSVIGQGVTAAIDGKRLNAADLAASAALTGAVNMYSGIGVGMGTSIQNMPAISTTSVTLANSVNAAWSVAVELMCDFIGTLPSICRGRSNNLGGCMYEIS